MHLPALALSLALAASPRKLGPYLIDPDTAGAQKVLAACPKVALYVLPNGMAMASINALLSSCPGTKVLLRVNIPDKYLLTADPVQSANNYWNRINGELTPYIGRDLWVEGPNGIDNVPDWTGGSATATAWLAQFTSTLADRIHNGGFNPVVGAIPSGSPKLASELGAGAENPFKATATAMKAKTYPWAWSYHAFSTSLLHSSAAEASSTLRYRQIRAECALEGVPLFLTAVGQANPGWLKRGTDATAYLEWLDWLDARLVEDGTLGAALYQLGGTTGAPAGYELSKLADGLAALIQSPEARDAGVDGPPPDGGPPTPPPAGMDAGNGGYYFPPGGGGTPAPERHGCSSAGAGSGTALAAAAFACLLLRRRRRG